MTILLLPVCCLQKLFLMGVFFVCGVGCLLLTTLKSSQEVTSKSNTAETPITKTSSFV